VQREPRLPVDRRERLVEQQQRGSPSQGPDDRETINDRQNVLNLPYLESVDYALKVVREGTEPQSRKAGHGRL